MTSSAAHGCFLHRNPDVWVDMTIVRQDVALLPGMETRRWHIRAASADDVPALVSLVQGYSDFEQIPGFDQAHVEAALRLQLAAPKMAAAWVALADGAPIGYLLAVYVFSPEHLGLTAQIDEFYVPAEHRHSGVGTALLEAAEATFAAAG